MKFSKELIKGSTKNLVLAVLKEGELHGYQILKEIKNRSNDALELGEGTIYPVLHALEKEGALESRWEEQANGMKRKYYKITQEGRRKLKEAKKDWADFSTAVNHILNSHPSNLWMNV